jgi:hypothetical protein
MMNINERWRGVVFRLLIKNHFLKNEEVPVDAKLFLIMHELKKTVLF